MNSAEPTCKEIVDAVTAYLEGAMPPAERTAFEDHLRICEGCAEYLEQMRATIRAAGRLSEDALTPEARAAFTAMFRKWRGG